MIGVPCVTTWFSSYRQLLGHDIVFFLLQQSLLLCRDDVATEMVRIRGQLLQ